MNTDEQEHPTGQPASARGESLEKWLRAGLYLPEPLRDFHDQKDVFKTIDGLVRPPAGFNRPTWIDAQVYVIDTFLFFMARRGYTLQRSRVRLQFRSLGIDVREFMGRQRADEAALFGTNEPPSNAKAVLVCDNPTPHGPHYACAGRTNETSLNARPAPDSNAEPVRDGRPTPPPSNALKPCPFCGSGAFETYDGWVICDSCSGTAPGVKGWNRRANEPPPSARPAQLVGTEPVRDGRKDAVVGAGAALPSKD